jgi:two-component system, NtrC family, nitrogen regulation response regulator GlnG
VKMLRLLQERQFERVGGSRTLTTTARVLAATNRNLEQLIAEGKFRADLYYRLKVVTLTMPPLRDRAEDIPELAHHFLFRFARELGRDVRGFAPEVVEQFQRHPWPGNVRELQGVIKESLLRATGQTLLPEFLPTGFAPGERRASTTPAGPTLTELIESRMTDGRGEVYDRVVGQVERELITAALRLTHGHQAQASELLGINRTTLRTKLKELGIAVDKVVTDRPAAGE